MNLEIDVETISFNGVGINADELVEVLFDTEHFYHFTNDGSRITIEKFDCRSLDNLIQL